MNADKLKQKANELRWIAVDMVYRGKDGHPGPALSIAEIVATLYFDIMNVKPENPEWEDRDRFILSKGQLYDDACLRTNAYIRCISEFKCQVPWH